MTRENIELHLAQAEIAVVRATAHVETQRQILHYSTRLGASELISLATALLEKVERNLVRKVEIRDRLALELGNPSEIEFCP